MYCYPHPHPAVSVDVAVFSVHGEVLLVLLIQRRQDPFAGCWALPGGFVEPDEDLEDAARRELREETGLSPIHLVQLRAFGAPDRDPRERVITVAYTALVDGARTRVQAGDDARAAAWYSPDALPELAFDHRRILRLAQERLREQAQDPGTVLDLMPPEFTLGQLQRTCEIVLGRPLDKRNFRRRVLHGGRLQSTGHRRRQGKHRPACLYRVKFPDGEDPLQAMNHTTSL